jgi:hypothetical protein
VDIALPHLAKPLKLQPEPINTLFSTVHELPYLTCPLKLIELAAVTCCTTESLQILLHMRLPNTDSADPHLNHVLKEMEEPSKTWLVLLMLLPSLVVPRSDNPLPNCTLSTTEQIPPRLDLPTQDTVEPHLTKLLNDNDDPQLAMFRIDKLEPRMDLERKLIELPTTYFPTTEQSNIEPILVRPCTEIADPTRQNCLKLSDEPNHTWVNVERLLPNLANPLKDNADPTNKK